jgi:hypothetical protein
MNNKKLLINIAIISLMTQFLTGTVFAHNGGQPQVSDFDFLGNIGHGLIYLSVLALIFLIGRYLWKKLH